MRISLTDALARLPGPAGERYASVVEYGTLTVEVYAPRGTDPQEPHTRDEAYIVMAGRGAFINGADRHPFGPGDVLFVPANVPHRFEEFTDDLTLWAIFCSPQNETAR
ncbi:MAG TPA: cupin domain-containing protein [Thermoanaerobaculia bacterium]